VRDFIPHIVVSILLLINCAFAFISARKKDFLSDLNNALIFVPMTLFPISILALGFALSGLAYDASRSSLTPRAWPIYALLGVSILYASWLVRRFKTVRWFIASICLLYVWITLFCMAYASLIVTNNVAI
jgi:hypothetical protein